MGAEKDLAVVAVAGCPLFAGLSREEHRRIAGLAHRRRAARREELFAQGEEPAQVHLLISGEVELTQTGSDGREVNLRLIGPGGVFALTAVLSDGAYPGTARAMRPSEALIWRCETFRDLIERNPRIASNALPILLSRVRDLENRLRELATERVAQRLARTLVRLARHAGKRVDRGVLIDLPLSREELARMTGTTLFTVSRLLSEWESRGLLQLGRERVLILHPHGIVQIAEDLDSAP